MSLQEDLKQKYNLKALPTKDEYLSWITLSIAVLKELQKQYTLTQDIEEKVQQGLANQLFKNLFTEVKSSIQNAQPPIKKLFGLSTLQAILNDINDVKVK